MAGPMFKRGPGIEPRHLGTAIDLLAEFGGYKNSAGKIDFDRAVRALCSQSAQSAVAVRDERFQAVVDPELMQAIVSQGSVEAAKEFYCSRWGFAESAVVDMGFRYVTTPLSAASQILERFGAERLIAAGVMMRSGLIGLDALHPVIEPFIRQDGLVVGFQRRASQRFESWVKKSPMGQKFASPFGATNQSRIGAGANLVVAAPSGTTVDIMEGPKDGGASRSMGRLPFARPGAGFEFPAESLALLADKNILLCDDSDDGGEGGRLRQLAQLQSFGYLQEEDATDGLSEAAQARAQIRKQQGLWVRHFYFPDELDATEFFVRGGVIDDSLAETHPRQTPESAAA